VDPNTALEQKHQALAFLEGLQKRLNSCLPPAKVLDPDIRALNARAKENYPERHLKGPESAFLNKYALPEVFQELTTVVGMSEPDARKALLNEYYPSMPAISEASPARTVKHPFTKVLGRSAADIYRQWTDPTVGSALVQSCPDFALRNPFPHKILFEGKYFGKGSLEYAKRTLVADIYQAFFYRGLPLVPETKRGRAAWDYDYACLLAFDASRGGALKTAWQSLPKPIRKGFWDGGNVFVMILGGEG
jgi:hypothetical protein